MSAFAVTLNSTPIVGTSTQSLVIQPKEPDSKKLRQAVVYLTNEAFKKIDERSFQVNVRPIDIANYDSLKNAKQVIGSRLATLEYRGGKMILSVNSSFAANFSPKRIFSVIVEADGEKQNLGFAGGYGIFEEGSYKSIQVLYQAYVVAMHKVVMQRQPAAVKA